MREETYKFEEVFLSPYAVKSKDTKGREREIEACKIRTDFQRDRDRIIHCKSFRRLKHKTQVFLSPEGDHYRTRLTHTLEVSQIARTVGRALKLNEDLIEAISMGHDLGHTPFGHTGERVLNRLTDGGFSHNLQSARVVKYLENDGAGLNLTYEVIDGIAEHRLDGDHKNLETAIVCFADRIAYINHDIDDGIRAGLLTEEMLPAAATKVLGKGKGERINTLVYNLVENSLGKPKAGFTEEVDNALWELRDFLFKGLYTTGAAKAEEVKANRLIESLFGYYYNHPEELPPFYKRLMDTAPLKTVVADLIASMTDRYAIKAFESVFVPLSWNI